MWKFFLSSSTFLKLYLKLRTVFQVSVDCLTRSVNLFPITVEAKQCFKKHCQVHSLSSGWTEHSPFKSCCWMPMGFLQVTQENIRVYFALRSYPVTWMKSSFQATDRHVTLNILSKSISPDFLNCGSKNQKGKKKKKRKKSTSNAFGVPIQGSRLLTKSRRKWAWLQVMHSSVTTKCHCNQSESL